MSGPEILSMSIVLRGDFVPNLFSPKWFQTLDVLKEVELDDIYKNAVTTPDVSSFDAGWFSFQATLDAMVFRTSQDPYFDKVKDIVLKIFDELPLPVKMLGINNEAHLKMRDKAELDKLGHLIAPKEGIWDDIFDDPKLLSMTVEGRPRADDYTGYQRVKIEPSQAVANAAFVQLNDHYEFEDGNKSKTLQTILTGNWNTNQEKWQNIIKKISGLV